MLIHVHGEYGLFTNPAMPADRVSFAVPPFSTLGGLLRAFYWKRGIDWKINRVWVMNELTFCQVMRNERIPSEKEPITQRHTLYVRNPSYVIHAQIIATEGGQEERHAQELKGAAMAGAWLRSGRRRLPPFLGARECGDFLAPPPWADFEERAARKNLRMPKLGSMPTKILYDETGTPVGAEWGEYVWENGSYALRDIP